MPRQKLSPSQIRILEEARNKGGKVEIKSSQLMAARALERVGLGSIEVGGSGKAYDPQRKWWWEFHAK